MNRFAVFILLLFASFSFLRSAKASERILFTVPNETPQSILNCEVIDNDTINHCQLFSDIQGSGFNEPTGITFDKQQQVIYVTNQLGNPGQVSKCVIRSDQVTSPCQVLSDEAALKFITPAAIKIHPKYRFAYVLNGFVDSISQCHILKNGNFAPCYQVKDTGNKKLFDTPISITFHPSLPIAYITNAPFEQSGFITRCQLDKQGYLTQCHKYAINDDIKLDRPFDIFVHPNGQQIYLTDLTANHLISCSLDQTGDWSNCQKNSSPLFAAPLGMILSQNKQYLYVTNYNNDSLLQCQLTASNAIGKCSLMKNKSKYQFKQPSFITII